MAPRLFRRDGGSAHRLEERGADGVALTRMLTAPFDQALLPCQPLGFAAWVAAVELSVRRALLEQVLPPCRIDRWRRPRRVDGVEGAADQFRARWRLRRVIHISDAMLDKARRRRCRKLVGLSGVDFRDLGGKQRHRAEAFGQPGFRLYTCRIVEEPDRGPPSAKPSIALVRKLGTNPYKILLYRRSLSPVFVTGIVNRGLSPVFSFATNSFLGSPPARAGSKVECRGRSSRTRQNSFAHRHSSLADSREISRYTDDISIRWMT
jgi:hypothetical protein